MFIPLVHDSIIIIGSRSVYTFGSRFTYKRWVRVLSKIKILAFLGKYSNIFVGSQSVSIEVRIIFLYCLLGLKACLLGFASISDIKILVLSFQSSKFQSLSIQSSITLQLSPIVN